MHEQGGGYAKLEQAEMLSFDQQITISEAGLSIALTFQLSLPELLRQRCRCASSVVSRAMSIGRCL